MGELIIQQSRRHGRLSEFIKRSGDTVTLGRGLDNDIILSDHFIAPRLLRFDYVDGEWQLTVLDKTNPVMVNNSPVTEDVVTISSGDELTVGRTHLVVLKSDHPVERTRKLMLSNWMTGKGMRVGLPVMAVLLSALATLLSVYLKTTVKIRWGEEFSAVLLSLFVIIIWAAGWALAGRLLRHKPNFFPQLFVIASLMAGLTLASLFTGYLEYATLSTGFGNTVEVIVLLAVLTVMLKYNLGFSTELKRTGLIAFSVVSVLAVFVLLMNHLEEREFKNWPEYSRVVKPPFARLTSDKSLDSYFNKINKNFDRLKKDIQVSQPVM